MLMEIVNVLVYGILGMGLITLCVWLFDLVVPYDFQDDIVAGNKGAAWACAGLYIALGFIMRSAIMAIPFEIEEMALAIGVMDSLIWAAVGLVLLAGGYFLIDLAMRRINFNTEIGRKNEAAGIVVFGIFVSLALVISGAIMG